MDKFLHHIEALEKQMFVVFPRESSFQGSQVVQDFVHPQYEQECSGHVSIHVSFDEKYLKIWHIFRHGWAEL